MKKILFLLLLILPLQANAASCSSLWSWATGSCPDYTDTGNDLLNVQPQQATDGVFNYIRISPENLTSSSLSECVVGGDIDTICIEAVAIQKMKTMQTQINGLSSVSRTFNYPSRTLNSCYQISSTRDSGFHYKIDVASGTLLSGTATGTVTATSYTNSGCTTGAQSVADGLASQGAALGVLSVSQTASVALDGMLPAGKWLKITTAQTTGTPTFSIRATQSEIIE